MEGLDGSWKDNYVSSSDEERESGEDSVYTESKPSVRPPTAKLAPSSKNGANTGPKGVIRDREHYKELREQEEAWKTHQRGRSQKQTAPALVNRWDENELPELELELESDHFLQQYREKRLREMRAAAARNRQATQQFGSLVHLSASTFLSAVDNEQHSVYVVVHIYDDSVEACSAMNGCLTCLASKYTQTMFCCLPSSDAPLSCQFKSDGLPALLVYKGGELIGNFIRVSDQLGDDFYAPELEKFLIDNDCLPLTHHVSR
jgi:hypothetical protein